ncbi:MAG: hypothetical protein K8H74_03345 [Notoacmeibacter sp.]|nr:hypothetical protein [Notoacmeibacter sp.]
MDQLRKPRQAGRIRLAASVRRASPLAAAMLALLLLSPAAADIRNDAVAVAVYGPDTVVSPPAGQSVPLAAAAPALDVSIVPVIESLGRADGIVDFTVTVANGGNVTLRDVRLSGTGVAEPACPSGNPVAELAPGDLETCQAVRAADDRGIAGLSLTATARTVPSGGPIADVQSADVSEKAAFPAVISGVVFGDANGNGVFDADTDPAFEGYRVDLVRGSKSVAAAVTGPTGRYAFPDVPPGPGHELVFRNSAGGIVGGLANIDVASGVVMTGKDLAINATGIVYDALSRRPVAGAVVTILDAAGGALPPGCFMVPGQQAQVTAANGAYRFDIAPGADPACPAAQAEYVISVGPPVGYASPSSVLPPLSGPLDMTACVFDAVPGGACQTSAAGAPPPPGSPAIHVLSVLLQAGDPPLIHNHIPLDPLVATAPPALTVTADKPALPRGGSVKLTIEIGNPDPLPAGPVRLTNVMPPGFAYVEGSARIDGEAVEPAVSPPALDFGAMALAGRTAITITLELEATAGGGPGRHVNRVRLAAPSGKTLAPDAFTEIEVLTEPASGCTEVSGRVFADTNRNARADTGEAGLGGVVIVTGRGTPVVTDRQGRFRVPCAELPDSAFSLVLTLSEESLPPGFRLTTGNPRTVQVSSASSAGAVDFGAAAPRVVRLDLKDGAFAGGSPELKPEWAAGIERLVGVLAEQPSTLRIIYKTGVEDGLARARLETVEHAVRQQWNRSGQGGGIGIDAELLPE